MIKILSFFSILFLGINFAQSAQNTPIKLTGQLLDSSGKALSNASIQLQITDSIRNYLSNSSGFFYSSLTDSATLRLTVTHQNKKIYDQTLHITRDTFITIYESATLLEEAVITALKPSETKYEGNKLVFYPSETLKQGKAVADLFAFTPMMQYKAIGNKGNPSLDILGKDYTAIFINGKLSFINKEILLTLLQGEAAALVEKIEIIQNPDVSYPIRQGGAVVNIVMQRNDFLGWNGSIALRNRQNSLNSQNAFLSLRHSHYNIKNHSNVWVQNWRARFSNNLNYDFIANDYVQNNNIRTPRSVNVSTGIQHTLNYDITKRQSLQLSASFAYSLNDYEQTNHNIFQKKGARADSNLLVNNHEYTPVYTASFSAYYTLQLRSKDILDFIFNYNFFRGDNTSLIHFKQGVQDLPALKETGLYRQTVPQIIHSFYGALIHKHTFKNKHTLASGGRFYYTNTNNNLQFYELLSEHLYLNNITRSNHFLYQEPIYELFTSYQSAWNKHFQTIIDFKLDYTQQIGKVIQTGQSFKRHLLFPLPQIHLIYNTNKNHQINLAINTQIIKPRYEQLNPFRVITGNNTYSSGNPFLRLPYVWNANLAYNMPHLHFSLGYANINPMYRDAQIYNPELHFVGLEPVNYGSMNRVYLLANYNRSFFKNYLTLSAQGIINYSIYKGRIPFSIIDRQGLGGILNINTHILISKKRKWSAGMSYDKVFPSMTFVGFIYEGYNIGANIQKVYKRWVFQLFANDIFRTNTLNDIFFMSNLHSRSRAYWDAQSLTLTIRYQFGNAGLKKSMEKPSGNANQGRIKKD